VDLPWEKPQTCFAPLGWLCGSPGILQLPLPMLGARCAAGAPTGAGTSAEPLCMLPASISPCEASVAPYWSLYYNNVNPLPVGSYRPMFANDNLKIEQKRN